MTYILGKKKLENILKRLTTYMIYKRNHWIIRRLILNINFPINNIHVGILCGRGDRGLRLKIDLNLNLEKITKRILMYDEAGAGPKSTLIDIWVIPGQLVMLTQYYHVIKN